MNPKFLAHYTDAEDKYIYDVFFPKLNLYTQLCGTFLCEITWGQACCGAWSCIGSLLWINGFSL